MPDSKWLAMGANKLGNWNKWMRSCLFNTVMESSINNDHIFQTVLKPFAESMFQLSQKTTESNKKQGHIQ